MSKFKEELFDQNRDIVSIIGDYIWELENEQEYVKHLKASIKNYQELIMEDEEDLHLANNKIEQLKNNIAEFYHELIQDKDEKNSQCDHYWENITDSSGMGGTGYYKRCKYCGEEE